MSEPTPAPATTPRPRPTTRRSACAKRSTSCSPRSRARASRSIRLNGKTLKYTAIAAFVPVCAGGVDDKRGEPEAAVFTTSYFLERCRPEDAPGVLRLQRRTGIRVDLAAPGRARPEARGHPRGRHDAASALRGDRQPGIVVRALRPRVHRSAAHRLLDHRERGGAQEDALRRRRRRRAGRSACARGSAATAAGARPSISSARATERRAARRSRTSCRTSASRCRASFSSRARWICRASSSRRATICPMRCSCPRSPASRSITASSRGRWRNRRPPRGRPARNSSRRSIWRRCTPAPGLPDAARRRAIKRVAELTGLSAALVEEKNLRISDHTFFFDLLRDRGQIVGRLEARVTGPMAASPHARLGVRSRHRGDRGAVHDGGARLHERASQRRHARALRGAVDGRAQGVELEPRRGQGQQLRLHQPGSLARAAAQSASARAGRERPLRPRHAVQRERLVARPARRAARRARRACSTTTTTPAT